jgi:membrane-associated phospholipid phosphatase
LDETGESFVFVTGESARADSGSNSVAVAPPGQEAQARDSTVAHRPRSVVRSLRHGARAFVSDVGYVVQAPTRLHAGGIAWLGGILTVGTAIALFDQEIYDAMRRSRHDRLYEIVLKPGRQWEPIGLMGITNKYYVGALVLGYTFRVRPLIVIPSQILESHLIGGGIRNVVKPIVGRARPADHAGPYHFEFRQGVSFPSGHASVDFELATILSHHAHAWPVTVLCYAVATSLGLQRVESGGHWMSDVFFSAASGTTIARTVIRRHEQREREGWEALVPVIGTRDGVPVAQWFTRF